MEEIASVWSEKHPILTLFGRVSSIYTCEYATRKTSIITPDHQTTRQPPENRTAEQQNSRTAPDHQTENFFAGVWVFGFFNYNHI